MAKTLVEQFVDSPEGMRSFQQEAAIYEITELIEDRLSNLGISRSELAAKLGKTKGWVTQLLDGESNKTIRTVADVFAVLGRSLHFSDVPIEISSPSEPVLGLYSPQVTSGVHDKSRAVEISYGEIQHNVKLSTNAPLLTVG